MLRYQPRLLRLRETAVAVLTCTPILMDWILAAPVLLTQNSRCYSIQRMGTSQRPSRAHSAYAKWPLPACNVWQRPRAVAWLAQGQTSFARCTATGPSYRKGPFSPSPMRRRGPSPQRGEGIQRTLSFLQTSCNKSCRLVSLQREERQRHEHLP